jgi:hypothetical protein
MKDTMRQQIDAEASAMLEKCADSGECEDLELLKEMCSNNILKLESCSDPRLQQRGKTQSSFQAHSIHYEILF